jgi:hypothetical protein
VTEIIDKMRFICLLISLAFYAQQLAVGELRVFQAERFLANGAIEASMVEYAAMRLFLRVFDDLSADTTVCLDTRRANMA